MWPRLESGCKVREKREANERTKGTINKYDFLLWKNTLECDDLENHTLNSRNNNEIFFKDINWISLQNDVTFSIASDRQWVKNTVG
jgi:hypothetical protein